MDLPRFDPGKIRVITKPTVEGATSGQSVMGRIREGLTRNWRVGGLPAVLGITKPSKGTYKKLDGTTGAIDYAKIARTPYKGLK